MCGRCLELNRRTLLLGGGVAAAALHTGAAQMVERLLGRMKPGRAVREQQAREKR